MNSIKILHVESSKDEELLNISSFKNKIINREDNLNNNFNLFNLNIYNTESNHILNLLEEILKINVNLLRENINVKLNKNLSFEYKMDYENIDEYIYLNITIYSSEDIDHFLEDEFDYLYHSFLETKQTIAKKIGNINGNIITQYNLCFSEKESEDKFDNSEKLNSVSPTTYYVHNECYNKYSKEVSEELVLS